MKIKPTRNSGGVALELGADEPGLPAAYTEPLQAALPLFKIRRILVPIDFSPCSKKALQYAVPFAEQFGARLCLLYVGQGYYLAPELAPLELTAYKLSERADTAGKLASFATQEVPTSIPVDILVQNGQPALEIARVAKESGADLIIISTHGYTGIKHAWFGSIAEQVVRHAACPVLVVRETEHEFVADDACTHSEVERLEDLEHEGA
jgi:nucleotide-binding universal stress UspA family protein